jgi:OmcA/MtrC family decaheme c-type cytochrome
MRTSKLMTLSVLVAAGIGLTACSGDTGPQGATGPTGPTGPAGSGVADYLTMTDAQRAEASFVVELLGTPTLPADGRPVVNLKITDRYGNGVKGMGPVAATVTAPGITWRFAQLQLAPAANGSNSYWQSFMPASTTTTASTENCPTVSSGVITIPVTNMTDNGDGTYAYRFTKAINNGSASIAYDAARNQRIVVLASYAQPTGTGSDPSLPRNVFAPINLTMDWIPATGAVTTGQNEKVNPAACFDCHGSFRAAALQNTTNMAGYFHAGGRFEFTTCVACHNRQQAIGRTQPTFTVVGGVATWTGSMTIVNGNAILDIPVFVHGIHMGEEMYSVAGSNLSLPGYPPYQQGLTGGSYTGFAQPYLVTYPQTVKNCDKCHNTVPRAANWNTEPTRMACGGCHNTTSFAATVPTGLVPHFGGPYADDVTCVLCHDAAKVKGYHEPTIPPNPEASFTAGGALGRLNAAWVAAAGTVPAGAAVIGYDIKSVDAVADSSNVKRPAITFRFTRDGAPVVFNTYSSTSQLQLMDGFVGSPSVQWAFAVPQDGIAAPADWNSGSQSCFIRDAWRGSNANCVWTVGTGANAGYYTITKKDLNVSSAGLLTGGIGYSYSLSATNQQQPLTQIDIARYPYTPLATGSPNGTGGLIVPVPDAWKTATSYTARRTIVETARCNDCHGFLGVAPTFHVGQRNDGPTCTFCHTANGVNSGWSYNIKDAVHAIHAAGMRNTDYTWEITAGATFWEVEYPQKLYKCEACHLPGTYDYSASTYLGSSSTNSSVASMLWSTVATGTYTVGSTTLSPYVQAGVAYGTGFTFSASFGTGVNAAGTTLVVSPITAACSACHDGSNAINHMLANGGVFYGPRNSVRSVTQEQCLMCHGPNTTASIKAVHANPGPGVMMPASPWRPSP